jgi:hypothetical protein
LLLTAGVEAKNEHSHEGTIAVARYGSIQGAVDAADGGERILVQPGTYQENVVIDKSVDIKGVLSAARTTVDGSANQASVFTIDEGAEVTLSDMTITGGSGNPTGYGYGIGGGIDNHGDLTVIDCVITDNQAGNSGGISNVGELEIIGSKITDNTAGVNYAGDVVGGDGGGINSGGLLTMTNCEISGNTAAWDGGGLNIGSDSLAVIDQCSIHDNEALGGASSWHAGGGIMVTDGGEVTLTNSDVSGNTAGQGTGVMVLSYLGSEINSGEGIPLDTTQVHDNIGGQDITYVG